jgi:hypothetical protein
VVREIQTICIISNFEQNVQRLNSRTKQETDRSKDKQHRNLISTCAKLIHLTLCSNRRRRSSRRRATVHGRRQEKGHVGLHQSQQMVLFATIKLAPQICRQSSTCRTDSTYNTKRHSRHANLQVTGRRGRSGLRGSLAQPALDGEDHGCPADHLVAGEDLGV